MTVQFDLTKDAGAAPIAFNLSKVSQFIVELFWDSKQDLDAHAIQLIAGHYGSGDDILSTYNTGLVLVDDNSKKHAACGKEPFQNSYGSLVHNGDKRTGISVDQRQPDEVMQINIAKIPADRDEVSFFITSHPPQSVKFKDVSNCKLVIKDDSGKQLLIANLTNDFDGFDMVQMGSIVRHNGNWEFNPVAVGINGNFNDILGLLA